MSRAANNSPPACVTLPSAPRVRRGFTLLELVLVLMLLVIVAGLAVPSLSRSVAGERLRRSGDTIRTQWARARVKAMKSGRIHVFQYQAGGDQYQTQPWIAAFHRRRGFRNSERKLHGQGDPGHPRGGDRLGGWKHLVSNG